MSRRAPLTDAVVLAAVERLEAAGQQPTCRAVHRLVGGSMSTVTEALRRLQLNHRVGTPLGLHSLLLASYARRVEQVDALLDVYLAAAAALGAAGLPVPALPANMDGAVLGSATWLMPGASSATPDGFVVLDPNSEGCEAPVPVRALPPQPSPAASIARSTQVLGTSDCNHEHSTCGAQAEKGHLESRCSVRCPPEGPPARHTGTQEGIP